MRKVFTLFLLLSLFFGCSNNNSKNQKNDVIEVDIDKMQLQFYDSTLIKDVKYIFLETNEDCYIGNAVDIMYQNETFYVAENYTAKGIFVFSKTGKFLYKITREGHGPGEYVNLLNFDLDKEGNVYVLDMTSEKIIKYFDNGKKFKEYKVNIRFFDFSIIDEKNIYAIYLFGEGKDGAVFCTYNIEEQTKTNIILKKDFYDDLNYPLNGSKHIYKSNNKTYISPQFRNVVYSVEDGKVIEKIKLNENSIAPQSYLNKMREDFMFQYKNDEYVTSITNIYENKSFLTMDIGKGFGKKLVIAENTGNKLYCFSWYNKNYFFSPSVKGVACDKFISSITPSDITTKENWQKAVQNSSVDEKTKKKFLELKDGDNPILVLFNFEEF